jgi:hypothetical protein
VGDWQDPQKRRGVPMLTIEQRNVDPDVTVLQLSHLHEPSMDGSERVLQAGDQPGVEAVYLGPSVPTVMVKSSNINRASSRRSSVQ